jgi:hypothetical protein
MIGKLIYEAEKFLDSTETGPELVEKYASTICTDLLFLNEKLVRSIADKMKQNVIDFAVKNSKLYFNFDVNKIYTREDLKFNVNWLVPQLKNEVANFNTSGSTSGKQFFYYVWKKYINFIEDKNQYGMILDEYEINRSIDNKLNILILINLHYNPKFKDFYIQDDSGHPYTMHTHQSLKSNRFFVNFENYSHEPEEWHRNLFQLFDTFNFDIVLTNSPILHNIVYYIKNFNYKKKLSKLISQTGQFLIESDKNFLLSNNFVENFCDHMRCWDGGATFFTCKHGNYHLMDNLSFVESFNKKMISTDYFSLPSPFINYWNGDLCLVSEDYKRCDCGRLFREFKMLENRPFALKGTEKLTNIRKQISKLDFKSQIKQVQFENFNVKIHVSKDMDYEQIKLLEEILKDYKINIYKMDSEQ